MHFYNWFCKRAAAKADFLGSSRKSILSLISYVSCWRSTAIFFCFSSSISTLILWAIDCWSRCLRLVLYFCHWFCAQVTAWADMLRSFLECNHWLRVQVTVVAVDQVNHSPRLLNSQLTKSDPLILKMASAQVVETWIANNSPSQNSYHPDDHFHSRYSLHGLSFFSFAFC